MIPEAGDNSHHVALTGLALLSQERLRGNHPIFPACHSREAVASFLGTHQAKYTERNTQSSSGWAELGSAALSFLNPSFSVQIRYWKDGDKEEAADRVRTAGLVTSAHVTGLNPNTNYHVSVRAYNRAGTGLPSASTNVTTTRPRE